MLCLQELFIIIITAGLAQQQILGIIKACRFAISVGKHHPKELQGHPLGLSPHFETTNNPEDPQPRKPEERRRKEMMLRCKIVASIRNFCFFGGLFVQKCPRWSLGRVEMTPERSVPALFPSGDGVRGVLRGEGPKSHQRWIGNMKSSLKALSRGIKSRFARGWRFRGRREGLSSGSGVQQQPGGGEGVIMP